MVEVMGRDRGFLALEVGIEVGAEVILVPEMAWDIEEICLRLEGSHQSGKKSGIVVMAEGAGNCMEIAVQQRRKLGSTLDSQG